MLFAAGRRVRDTGWIGLVSPNHSVRRLLELVGALADPAFHVFAGPCQAEAAAETRGQCVMTAAHRACDWTLTVDSATARLAEVRRFVEEVAAEVKLDLERVFRPQSSRLRGLRQRRWSTGVAKQSRCSRVWPGSAPAG